jgi:hypothetical protein
MPFCLPEHCKIVNALAPAADAGGRTSAVVTLKDTVMAWIVLHITQGNAATIAITVEQATAIVNTGHKAITNVVPIWSDLDCAASDAFVRRTAAVSYTTDAGVKIKQIVFQIDPASLDVANGFDCLSVITGASNAANITEAQFYLQAAYPSATPSTAVVD